MITHDDLVDFRNIVTKIQNTEDETKKWALYLRSPANHFSYLETPFLKKSNIFREKSSLPHLLSFNGAAIFYTFQ